MITTLTISDIRGEQAGLYLTTQPPPPPPPLPSPGLAHGLACRNMIRIDETARAISAHTLALAQVIFMAILIQIITKVTKTARGSANPVLLSTPLQLGKLVHGLAGISQTNNSMVQVDTFIKNKREYIM